MARKKRRGRIRRAASERQRAHQLTLDAPTWRNLSRLARLHRTSRSAIVRRLIASETGNSNKRPKSEAWSLDYLVPVHSPPVPRRFGPGLESDQIRQHNDTFR